MSDVAEVPAPEPFAPVCVGVLDAPVLVVDTCPNWGFRDGIGNMTLATAVPVLGKDGTIRTEIIAVAHARFGLDAARALRDTLDKIILMATPPEGQPN